MQDDTDDALENRENQQQGLRRQDLLLETRGCGKSWFPWEGVSGWPEEFSGLLGNRTLLPQNQQALWLVPGMRRVFGEETSPVREEGEENVQDAIRVPPWSSACQHSP